MMLWGGVVGNGHAVHDPTGNSKDFVLFPEKAEKPSEVSELRITHADSEE